MTEFVEASPMVFDRVLEAHRVRDEHEFLESRFLDQNGRVVAKVVREADEEGTLVPEAKLLVASDLVPSDLVPS